MTNVAVRAVAVAAVVSVSYTGYIILGDFSYKVALQGVQYFFGVLGLLITQTGCNVSLS